MVSQAPIETAPTTPVHDRGFIPAETLVATGQPGNLPMTMYYRPFWRPVVAGSVFTVSVFTLSWYLMLGCHVGVNDGGFVDLGVGSAVWLCITSCVAYFFGAMIASAMTMPDGMGSRSGFGQLKGAVMWGFSIPLAAVIYGFVASTGMVAALSLPHAAAVEPARMAVTGAAAHSLGFYWAAFIATALGLVFSLFGSATGCAFCKRRG